MVGEFACVADFGVSRGVFFREKTRVRSDHEQGPPKIGKPWDILNVVTYRIGLGLVLTGVLF